MIKKLRNYILALSLALVTTFSYSSSKAYADDIFKGVKGPTNWQTDERVSLSKNEKNVKTLTNNLILKYWDGKELGKYGFLSLPYSFIDSPDGSDNGLGDISVGFGPRGAIKNLHWFLYETFTLPTGDSEGKIKLGNGRVDTKFSGLATYMTSDKTLEIDGSLEYNFTGKNKGGVNPPNEVSMGLLGGGRFTNRIRFATGVTGLIKDNGDYLLNSRSVIRYTPSQELHFEFVGDWCLENEDIPRKNGIGFYLRYNPESFFFK
jgi:hypothetical protein